MKVKCAYQGCGKRRKHHESDELREHQMVEVPDGFEGQAFCSVECFDYFHGITEEE